MSKIHDSIDMKKVTEGEKPSWLQGDIETTVKVSILKDVRGKHFVGNNLFIGPIAWLE